MREEPLRYAPYACTPRAFAASAQFGIRPDLHHRRAIEGECRFECGVQLRRLLDELTVAAAIARESAKFGSWSEVCQTFQFPASCSALILPSWLLFSRTWVMFMPYLTAVKRSSPETTYGPFSEHLILGSSLMSLPRGEPH